MVALALAGCSSSESPPTQVIVSIHSDLEVGDELASVVVHVLDPDSDKLVSQHPFELTDREPRRGEVRLPFSLGLSKGKKDRFKLDVVGYGPTGDGDAEEAIVEQKVLGRFRDQETLLLKVFLSRVCFRKLCEDGETCHPEADDDDDVDAGDCGDLLEPSLTPTRAGAERDAWPDDPRDVAGSDGGAAGSGESGRGGSSGAAGRAGDSGGEAGESAAGTGGEAGEGAAGETGEAGEGSAGAGSGGDGGATAGSGGAAGSSGAGSGGAGSGGSGGTPGSCVPTGETYHASEGADHVMGQPQVTTPDDYTSDPPSSGLHCDAWAQYTTFTPAKPAPLCHWVHALEHGAVVLLYNCPEDCPQIVAGLEQVIADAPPDPNCANLDPPIKRLILTPYSGMSAKFAATTWQYTWTSNCDTLTAADREALLDFIDAHWGSPKSLSGEKGYCNNGSVEP